MTRGKNESIGKSGEKRILKILKEFTEESNLHESHNEHPDIVFDHLNQTFAAECKTVAGVYKYTKKDTPTILRERIGQIHIRRTEYNAMKQVDPSFTRCLIVEIRPPQLRQKDYIYIYVPWIEVAKVYEENHPEILSRSIWWIMKHGVDLRWYLNCLELIK